MRSSIAFLSALALRLAAAAAGPDDGFHLASIMAGYSGGCPAAETVRMSLTAQSMVIDYLSMGGPASRSAACVMLFDLAAVPDGWRFAVDEVKHEGHVKLAKGAAAASSQFYLGITNSHVVNPQDGVGNYKWSVNSGYFVSFYSCFLLSPPCCFEC